ncbi:hypothetical protein SLE2022_169750 [Rubroshorea leprosula]
MQPMKPNHAKWSPNCSFFLASALILSSPPFLVRDKERERGEREERKKKIKGPLQSFFMNSRSLCSPGALVIEPDRSGIFICQLSFKRNIR